MGLWFSGYNDALTGYMLRKAYVVGSNENAVFNLIKNYVFEKIRPGPSCGDDLVVMIGPCQGSYPGSNPGRRIFFS